MRNTSSPQQKNCLESELPMKVVIGSDHAGLSVEERHRRSDPFARPCGVWMSGAFNENPSDYPDFAEAVGRAILDGKAERGVLICGSGIGASVAANKLTGIRAGICHDTYSGHQGVEHDNMNVFVMGSRVIGEKLAEDVVRAFLPAKFTNEERHVRRLAKVHALEEKSVKKLKSGFVRPQGRTIGRRPCKQVKEKFYDYLSNNSQDCRHKSR